MPILTPNDLCFHGRFPLIKTKMPIIPVTILKSDIKFKNLYDFPHL